MAATFDNAVDKLIEACITHTGWTAVERVVVVRDLRGRLRLALKPRAGAVVPDVGPALTAALGPWFAGPVLSSDSTRPDQRRLAAEILGRTTAWPAEWPSEWTDLGGTSHPLDLTCWTGVQRVHSKQSWFGPPNRTSRWPLIAGVPAVVAFYSFKGGVGRTTTVALVASALARSGKRVICVDLDLEAPGLGDFLGASPAPSLLDALLGHAATGLLPTEELVQWVNVHQTKIGVVSAGALDRSYLEKLARLDYLGSASEDDSPVAKALRDVLHRLRTHSPDVILLDCRAGLHDLGGLSLTDLAHVDVLVARDTPQNHHGLRLTLEVLKRRREAPERRVLVVHTFVPFPLTGEPARFTRARMRSKLHDACTVTIYEGSDDCPSRDTDDVPHDAAPFAERNDVTAAQRLSDIEVEAVGTGGLTEIVHRLKALLQPEAP